MMVLGDCDSRLSNLHLCLLYFHVTWAVADFMVWHVIKIPNNHLAEKIVIDAFSYLPFVLDKDIKILVFL